MSLKNLLLLKGKRISKKIMEELNKKGHYSGRFRDYSVEKDCIVRYDPKDPLESIKFYNLEGNPI